MIASITAFDTAVEQALFAVRTPVLVKILSVITELGSGLVVILIATSVFLMLLRSRELPLAAGLFTAVAGAIASTEILKLIVARPRPPAPFPAIVETGYSFPSWHSVGAMAIYGFLAYAVWKIGSPNCRRGLWISVLSTLILLIGFTRLYLGVHYLSDVLAGYALGAFFVWLGAKAVRKFERRGATSPQKSS